MLVLAGFSLESFWAVSSASLTWSQDSILVILTGGHPCIGYLFDPRPHVLYHTNRGGVARFENLNQLAARMEDPLFPLTTVQNAVSHCVSGMLRPAEELLPICEVDGMLPADLTGLTILPFKLPGHTAQLVCCFA